MGLEAEAVARVALENGSHQGKVIARSLNGAGGVWHGVTSAFSGIRWAMGGAKGVVFIRISKTQCSPSNTIMH